MNTKTTEHIYTEWLSPDKMYEQSRKWFSELTFITEEQHFLNQIITSFGLKTIAKKEFIKINNFKKALQENKIKLSLILNTVNQHNIKLNLLVLGIANKEIEKTYQKTHHNLAKRVNEVLLDYRTTKQNGFIELTAVQKNNPQKIALGNPNYMLRTIPKMSIRS